MAVKYINGLKSIKMGALAGDGGASTTLTEVFGNTVTGSASITTEDPTSSDIFIEESDSPVKSITTQGAQRVAWSTYNTGPEALLAAFGGTLTGTAPNQTWNAPDSIVEMERTLQFDTNDEQRVVLARVKLNPKMGIVFDKTQLGKIDFTGTILQPTKAGVPRITIGPAIPQG